MGQVYTKLNSHRYSGCDYNNWEKAFCSNYLAGISVYRLTGLQVHTWLRMLSPSGSEQPAVNWPFMSKCRSPTALTHMDAAASARDSPFHPSPSTNYIANLCLAEGSSATSSTLFKLGSFLSQLGGGLLSEEASWAPVPWPGRIPALTQRAKMYQHSQPKIISRHVPAYSLGLLSHY